MVSIFHVISIGDVGMSIAIENLVLSVDSVGRNCGHSKEKCSAVLSHTSNICFSFFFFGNLNLVDFFEFDF